MAVGDYKVRVNRVGNRQGVRTRPVPAGVECVAYVMRCDKHGDVEVMRAHGWGEAMALRELYRMVRALLGLVKCAGELAVSMLPEEENNE